MAGLVVVRVPIKAIRLGALGDRAAPGDYNGDGLTDAAVFRPSAGRWLILPSGEPSPYPVAFGADGDLAAPGEFPPRARESPVPDAAKPARNPES